MMLSVKIWCCVFALLCMHASYVAANPMDNVQWSSLLHWYQLENQKLQLQHHMDVIALHKHMIDLQRSSSELQEKLESTQHMLISARATIQMQTQVIRGLLRQQ